MIIQLDKGLFDLLPGHPEQPSHQDHEREKNLCDQPSQFMRKKDVLSPENGEDEEEPSGEHKKDQNGEGESEEEGKRGMDVSQPHHGDIPEHKDEEEEDQTGNHQKTNKDPLLRSDFQINLQNSSE
jgi:hypothetical protein